MLKSVKSFLLTKSFDFYKKVIAEKSLVYDKYNKKLYYIASSLKENEEEVPATVLIDSVYNEFIETSINDILELYLLGLLMKEIKGSDYANGFIFGLFFHDYINMEDIEISVDSKEANPIFIKTFLEFLKKQRALSIESVQDKYNNLIRDIKNEWNIE